MSYKAESHRVLVGSLNLLSPSDKIPDSDSLQITNFRIDQDGCLRSRLGMSAELDLGGIQNLTDGPYGNAAAVHSMARRGAIYYFGAGGSLYRIGSSTPLTAAGDGRLFAMAAMNGYMWVMNRGVQGKDDGTTFSEWLPAPPAAGAGSPGAVIYNAGTVSVTNGSATVLGTGVNWSAGYPGPDDAFQVAGDPAWYTVADYLPVGDTLASVSLTLNAPYAGTTNAAATYSITVITGGGSLTAVAGSPIPDLPYVFTATPLFGGADGSTALVNNGSALVTGIPPAGVAYPWITGINGYIFQVAGDTVYYVIQSATADQLILDRPYEGGSSTDASYGIYQAGSFPQQGEGGPQGTYQYYVTLVDNTGVETSPGPVSASFGPFSGYTAVNLSNIPISTDPSIVGRNIYATGGMLGAAYMIPPPTGGAGNYSLNDNAATTFSYSWNDGDITTFGVLLQVGKDPAPACAGMSGPYFARLLAFNSALHPNRLWWTKPTQPFYWYYAASEVQGNWVDVGEDGEAILNVTCHARVAVIYKERSIWRLIGDPDTGTLEQVRPKIVNLGPRAQLNAGKMDYFATVDGLYSFDQSTETKVSDKLDPLFQGVYTQLGPVNIPPLDESRKALCCMELFMGMVFFAYPEAGLDGLVTCTNVLVFHIETGRFAQFKYNSLGINSLLYPAGSGGNDFWAGLVDGGVCVLNTGLADLYGAIALAYQSRYQDQGAPDTDKVYTALSIEYEMTSDSDTLTVTLWYDNGSSSEPVGSLVRDGVTGRQTQQWGLGADQAGQLARNASVRVEGAAAGSVVIHAVYLYYYLEALVTTSLVTIPLDLGSSKVKQFKELQLDIDASAGGAFADFSTDLPGNALAVRESLGVPQPTGRRNYQLPFLQTSGLFPEGRLMRLAIACVNGCRLYSARVLMRVIGTYLEGYELQAGFVWDSQPQDFSSHVTRVPRTFMISLHADPIKRARCLEIEIDTRGSNVLATLLSDQPGNAMAERFSGVLNTANDGQKILRLWLGQIEGHLFQLQLSGGGAASCILFGARIEILPIGIYFATVEAQGGAWYDSREVDFGVNKYKEARELEIDLDSDGPTLLTLYSDSPGAGLAARVSVSVSTAGGLGRRKVMVPLTPWVIGRLMRLTVGSSDAFRVYDMRIRIRTIGTYLDVMEATGGALWDSTELDCGSQRVKQWRALELDILTYAATVCSFYTELPGEAMTVQQTNNVDTSATGTRRTVQIPLPQGLNPFLAGRLMRATLAGSGAFILYGARVEYREVGVYVEAYEAFAGAVWDSSPLDTGGDNVFDQLRIEIEADGGVGVTLWTDLPGETLTGRFTSNVSTSGFGRRWVTMPLPGDTQGRIVRVVVQSDDDFILYKAEISKRAVGRYLAVGVNDTYRSLDHDFGSQRVKQHKYLEVDCQTDGPLTLTMYTDGPPPLSAVYTATIDTGGVRMPARLRLPGNVRGRISRVEIGGASSGRLYSLRTWARTMGEPSEWGWQAYPMEASEPLATWMDLGVTPTPAEFQWADLPVEPTAPEWSWQLFPLGATGETPPQWAWAVFEACEETPSTFSWVEIPMGPS